MKQGGGVYNKVKGVQTIFAKIIKRNWSTWEGGSKYQTISSIIHARITRPSLTTTTIHNIHTYLYISIQTE